MGDVQNDLGKVYNIVYYGCGFWVCLTMIWAIIPLLCILEDNEMLQALYDFEATLAKTLSFTEGEFFYLQQHNTKQRNWWHVVNRKGQVGFVPSNYVATVKVQLVPISFNN